MKNGSQSAAGFGLSALSRAIQTGPKIHLGGFHEGFCRPAYHSPGRKNPPIAAAVNDIASQAPSANTERVGLTGLLYWYALYPVHALIFSGLVRRLAACAEAIQADGGPDQL
jgi:hypothetical protein